MAEKCLKDIFNELKIDPDALGVTVYNDILKILLGFMDSGRGTAIKLIAVEFISDLLIVIGIESKSVDDKKLSPNDIFYKIEGFCLEEKLDSSLKIALISQYPKVIAAVLLILSNEDDRKRHFLKKIL